MVPLQRHDPCGGDDMRTYRPKDTVDGVVHQSRRWWLDFHDHQGVRRRLAGTTDRRATEAIGRTIQRLVWCKAAGEPPEPSLISHVGTMPLKLQDSLCCVGLVGEARGGALRPLLQHLEGTSEAPGFRESLVARGATAAYVDQAVSRTRRVIQGCGFCRWNDISAGKVMVFLHGLRQACPGRRGTAKRGISAQSFNGYLAAMKAFCKWMVDEEGGRHSPLAHLVGLNVRADRRHDRRAMSAEEIGRLLAATRDGPPRCGTSGPQRAMLYRLAVETGLRAGEIASLTPESFDLSAETPTVTVQAAYSKRRRLDVLPLRLDTARELRDFLKTATPGEVVFKVPAGRFARIFRADLAAARQKWIEQSLSLLERQDRERSSLLCYRDSSGRVADFHALRHSCASLLAAAGVHPKVVQVHMRLSTVEMTLGRYTHVLAGQQAAALAALPSFSMTPACGTISPPHLRALRMHGCVCVYRCQQ
jgi:integrase